MGRSKRAATSLDKVDSSGININRLFVAGLVFVMIFARLFSCNSIALARSEREQ